MSIPGQRLAEDEIHGLIELQECLSPVSRAGRVLLQNFSVGLPEHLLQLLDSALAEQP